MPVITDSPLHDAEGEKDDGNIANAHGNNRMNPITTTTTEAQTSATQNNHADIRRVTEVALDELEPHPAVDTGSCARAAACDFQAFMLRGLIDVLAYLSIATEVTGQYLGGCGSHE